MVLNIGVVTTVILTISAVQESIAVVGDFTHGVEFSAVEVHPSGRQPAAIPDELERTIREVTAYNVGDPGQTDGSPCLTADGSNACEELAQDKKICAANFVPIGTKLLVKNLGTFTVKDRMNRRYKDRIDIAMQAHEKQRAGKFGRQNLEVRILK